MGLFFKTLTNYDSCSILGRLWVGAKDDRWIDGRVVDSSFWLEGEPNNSDEECTEVVFKIWLSLFHIGTYDRRKDL